MSRDADTMDRVMLKLAVGGWITVSRGNAATLCRTAGVEVEIMNHATRYRWAALAPGFNAPARTRFRARKTPAVAPV